MKIGFSSLALFMKPLDKIFQIAKKDGFAGIEILCEGPYWPRYLINNRKKLKIDEIADLAKSCNIEIFLHAPTIDLNPASMNKGIRDETEKQTIETLNLADILNAEAITTHPGMVHRRERRIRDLAIEYSIETLKNCQDYADDIGITLSIENMPKKFSYLANCPVEHKMIVENVGSSATIDWGHANTYKNPLDILKTHNIAYFHLNDNNGLKDQHLLLGEGTSNFNYEILKCIDMGIIELNSYEDVLKSKKFLITQLGSENK
ncbi:endonuclease 4 [Methanobrevibacter cuticularis]|uniref:Endonuclease 4 n=1 Tax=Methanobrevibacter cuticularis TaxID=47311 RepID=A0A166ECC4_9EURY|nr:sugar phosphate isomerase/epimerase [Methanobrevibacter cuticularis]KZX16501.1 endonuclease 4 [Methanobrevibacter cuticularis]